MEYITFQVKTSELLFDGLQMIQRLFTERNIHQARKLYSKSRINPLRPNNDLSQTSHWNIKGLSVSEVMRIENMITQVKFYLYFNSFSSLLL